MSWRGQPIALLLDGEEGVDAGNATRKAAVYAVRAALERGCRVLLHADPASLLLLAMTATAYRAPQGIEGAETQQPPLIALPTWQVESAEAEIFEGNGGDEQGFEPPNLFSVLLDARTLDFPWGSERVALQQLAPTFFQQAFSRYVPWAILALSETSILEASLEGAEAYWRDGGNSRLIIARRGFENTTRKGWEELERLAPGAPPNLGELTPSNEALREATAVADYEAWVGLAIEQLLEQDDRYGFGDVT